MTATYQPGPGTTATLGEDFLDQTGGQLTFDPQVTEAEVVLALLDDTTPEGVELIELVLETATGAVVGASSSIVLALVDDDSLTGVNQDFNLCGPGLPLGWESVDPQGVGALSFRGAGTSDAGVVLTIPRGPSSPGFGPPRDSGRVRAHQLQHRGRLLDAHHGSHQMQGVLFEDGMGQWLRVDFSRTGSGTLIFFIGKDPAPGQSVLQIANGVLNPAPLDGARLRIARQGWNWVVELWDGLGWYQPISNCEFEVTGFAPNSVSLWAGNYANGGGHDVVVDWIQDSFDPIDPEDGPLAGGVGRTLSVTVVDTTGQPITGGEVVADPDQTEFWCEDVQLTINKPGWLFDRWEVTYRILGTPCPSRSRSRWAWIEF